MQDKELVWASMKSLALSVGAICKDSLRWLKGCISYCRVYRRQVTIDRKNRKWFMRVMSGQRDAREVFRWLNK